MVREIASPSPVPGMVSASGLVERWNAENRWTWSDSEMPRPVSLTDDLAAAVALPTTTSIRPPGGVYFTALLHRLSTTRGSSSASPMTMTGCLGLGQLQGDAGGLRLDAQHLERTGHRSTEVERHPVELATALDP